MTMDKYLHNNVAKIQSITPNIQGGKKSVSDKFMLLQRIPKFKH